MGRALVKLFVTPLVLLLGAELLEGVYLQGYWAAFWVSLGIIAVGFLLGWIFTLFFNLITLGLFWAVGLGIVTRTLAYTAVIELVDELSSKLHIDSFWAGLGLSILLALAWSLMDRIGRPAPRKQED